MQEKRITRVEFPSKGPHSEQPPPKKRVAVYARVSTMKEAQENSLQSQREYFTDYIGRHPDWVFAGMYTDDGLSGLSIRKRDGFTRMVADALDGKIDMIITKSLSRFARNTVDTLTTIRNLKAAGVAVYFQRENINTVDSTGEFLITLMSSFAEEESRSIRHLLKTHNHILTDCADLLDQAMGGITKDVQSALDDIARGKLDIQIDGLMIRILIRKMVVTPKRTLVIHFLDGSTYCHRLGNTPRGTRLYNTQRDHSRILALSAEGCTAREISQRLGISVNTVRSFLRRHHGTRANEESHPQEPP